MLFKKLCKLENKKWFTTGKQKGIACLNCGNILTDVGYIHTNTGVCPSCKIQCIFYGIGMEDVIQVLPQNAPESFRKFIDWFQSDLNEIEFLELVGSLKRIAIALNNDDF